MPGPAPRLSRRGLLRGLGALGALGVLAGCERGAERSVPEAILDKLQLKAPQDLSVIMVAPYLFSGRPQRVVFGLGTSPTDFRPDLDLRTWVVRDQGLQVVSGPHPATFHDEGLEGLGVYLVTTQFDRPGNYWLVATDDEHAAVGAMTVYDPSQSQMPDIGQPFPSAKTPTTAAPLALKDVCTRKPPCGMHDVSLDAARKAGRPVVLVVATPAYCQTRICGPVVDIIEGVRKRSPRTDVAWIHVEVYSDAGNTPLPFVAQTVKLPSEPWTFFVGKDGRLADRLQGPTPADLVRSAIEQI